MDEALLTKRSFGAGPINVRGYQGFRLIDQTSVEMAVHMTANATINAGSMTIIAVPLILQDN